MAEHWIPAEDATSLFDAQVAAHDYAHEGWYFRIRRESERLWTVWVKWGRINRPACCRPSKRRYVDEPLTSGYKPHRTTRRLKKEAA